MSTAELTTHLQAELAPSLGQGEANSVARLVLEDLFGWRRGHRPRQLDADEQLLAWTTINRLKAGEPVQYVTGIADFYGLQLLVTPDVLIPRPETEALVEWILEDHPKNASVNLVDLGTGSGCIPIALKHRRPTWHCAGYDLSEAALAVARTNAEKYSLEVSFAQLDVLHTPDSQLHTPDSRLPTIIVSNPPYIPPSERDRMSPSTLAHEPELALFVPEDDPLLFYRRIAELGRDVLREGEALYFETNAFNNDAVAALLQDLLYKDVERRKDMSGNWRMVKAVR